MKKLNQHRDLIYPRSLLVSGRAGDSNSGTGFQDSNVLPLSLPENMTHKLEEPREQSGLDSKGPREVSAIFGEKCLPLGGKLGTRELRVGGTVLFKLKTKTKPFMQVLYNN